ncbi:GAF domain-containing protein, partial [bacterium]|nr:GAF domain-containing protein [bacterium]
VGFYLVDKSGKNLVLGPYSGKPTEHKKIPFGKGVCGQVAQKKKTMVVQDISQETNYLSCSLDVKSEAAVPIIKDLNFVGALDVDSNEEAPFKRDDVAYLEDICHLVEKLF